MSTAEFLAFDLGAESGRAVRGSLVGELLTISEVCRFPNGPARDNGSQRWDVYRLWREMQLALTAVEGVRFESVGIDAWGCDYGLLREDGSLIELPYTYRDRRTAGMMDRVLERISRDRIYNTTGIQFLWFNTLYQLYAACELAPQSIAGAHRLGTIPDVMNYWLTGSLYAEFTNATTTQCIDARSRQWATELLGEVGIPTRLFPELVEPGSVIGVVRRAAGAALAGTPVVAPACHDTGSAFAAVEAGGDTAFLSSGTWSLLGTEVAAPIINDKTRELDFTNEGGVCGTTRLLKNIGGLWLLQSCRRSWATAGTDYGYDELVAAADQHAPFQVLIDPDWAEFRNPDDMVAAINGYVSHTRQPPLNGPSSYSRAIFESLAFKYRAVLESLEEITGQPITRIRVVGGGARNRLLNQFTANATGRTVVAGPAEATALGNIAMQMLASGVVSSLAEARTIIDRSFPVERFEPIDSDRWEPHYRRFQEFVEITCA